MPVTSQIERGHAIEHVGASAFRLSLGGPSAGGRTPRYLRERRLGREIERLVERAAQRGRVQADGVNARGVQIVQGTAHEGPTNPATSERLVHQHHGDPRHRAEPAGRHGAGRDAVELGDETTVRLQVEQAPPVSLDLVPAGLILQTHAQRDIGRRHRRGCGAPFQYSLAHILTGLNNSIAVAPACRCYSMRDMQATTLASSRTIPMRLDFEGGQLMATVDKPRKKRIFIASAQADVAQVQKAMQQFDLDAVTLDQLATPGTTWVDSLHRCLNDADMVIGIMGDRRKDTNVFFELGVASALNKPTLLFITPDYPIDHIPPSGIPYLRMDLRNEDAVMFGLKQALSLSPRDPISQPAEGFATRPIGPLADQLLAKLAQAGPRDFEDLIYDAIKASGATTIARGSEGEDRGIDFAVWSSDLEPTITNPLLIECKSSLRNQSDLNEAIGRMFRALEAIPGGWGIVLYKEAGRTSKAAPRSLPVAFVSAEDFISGLRDTGLAEYVRKLRNSAFHGS